MIALQLLDALNKFLEATVKEYQLATSEGCVKSPQVVSGFLPPKGDTDFPDFPFVTPRLIRGEDTAEVGTVTVKIIVGTYAEDNQGWRDSLILIEHIRQVLFTKRILAKKYRVEYPFKWEQPEEQALPYWLAEMTTTWTVPRPIEEVYYDEEDDACSNNWAGAGDLLRP